MKIFSVTEVLGKYFDWGSIPDQILAEACQRGHLVHTAAACHALGAWCKPLPDIYEDYLKSFKHWYDRHVTEAILVEQRFTDDVLGYTGQLDLVARLFNNDLVLVDIKTPLAESKSWKVQVAAYCNLAAENGCQVDYAMAVQPKRNGGAATCHTYHKTEDDYAIFMCALTAHRNLT